MENIYLDGVLVWAAGEGFSSAAVTAGHIQEALPIPGLPEWADNIARELPADFPWAIVEVMDRYGAPHLRYNHGVIKHLASSILEHGFYIEKGEKLKSWLRSVLGNHGEFSGAFLNALLPALGAPPREDFFHCYVGDAVAIFGASKYFPKDPAAMQLLLEDPWIVESILEQEQSISPDKAIRLLEPFLLDEEGAGTISMVYGPGGLADIHEMRREGQFSHEANLAWGQISKGDRLKDPEAFFSFVSDVMVFIGEFMEEGEEGDHLLPSIRFPRGATVIPDTKALLELARRYRNCLGMALRGPCLRGEALVLELDGELVVHLDPGLNLVEVKGPSNSLPSAEQEARVHEWLEELRRLN